MSNKSIIIITVIAALAVTAICAGTYFYGLKAENLSRRAAPAITETPDQNAREPIGGQTDEHGCLVAAGYSWCEAGQKCLRVFEEFCPDQAAGLVAGIEEVSGVELLPEGETTFNWIISDGQTMANRLIAGIVYRATGVKRADYDNIENFMNANHETDTNNLADGVVGGLRGYRDGYMACLLNFRHAAMTENEDGIAEPAGDDLEVKLECGYYNPNDNDAVLFERKIAELLAAKYEKTVSEATVKVTASDETHAAGSVSFGPGPGEGGMFLAVKTDNGWKVVYDGNGSVDCMVMRQTFRFPADILEGFCD